MCRVDNVDDHWTVYRTGQRTAQRAHRCHECQRTIRRGERYRSSAGLFDRAWSTHKMCAHCWAASDWLDVMCGGWLWGEVLEELEEHWLEGYKSWPFAFLIARMRHRWHDGRADIPDNAGEIARAFLAPDLTRS